jgi:L-aminopeptidase/D-esterase-like protein
MQHDGGERHLVRLRGYDGRDLRTLGRQVHASMARAIQPFHALEDGDVLFAVSTGVVESDPLLDTTALGVVASEVAWDAVLSVVG